MRRVPALLVILLALAGPQRHPLAAPQSAIAARPQPQTAANPLLEKWSGPFGGVPPWQLVRPELFPPAFEAALA